MGRKKPSILDEQDRELLTHIQSLGLNTVEEYRAWCADQGFSRQLIKDWKQRCQEWSVVQQAAIQARLQRHKREKRSVVHLYADICAGRLTADELNQPHLKRLAQAIHQRHEAEEPGPNLAALNELLLRLHTLRFELADLNPVIPEYGVAAGNTYLEAVVRISAHRRAWLRPLETWSPRTHNSRRQFASLLRHLFVQYDDMPLFFDAVWFAGPTRRAIRQRQAYRHVGYGRSIRLCQLPIPYTKRMAHHFMHAPADLTPDKALRWGQVLGLGGDERLARAIMGTRLAECFDTDEFWQTVIEWFIAHPTFCRRQIGPMIDYLQHQRFTPQEMEGGELGPLEPNLTMKGRTPESLLRKMNNWHRTLGKSSERETSRWAATGIDEFEFLEGSTENGTRKVWRIRELLTSRELTAEGRRMKHCVGIYISSCKRGSCSIWTMELDGDKGLTIEVRNHLRQIVQARGTANRLPTAKELSVLRRWAIEACLTISKSVTG